MQTLRYNNCLTHGIINTLLDPVVIKEFLEHLGSGWQLNPGKQSLSKTFHFNDPYQTIAFVNAIGWMIHFKNHPPVLEINRNNCIVSYTTEEVGGLSEYDFLCAHKVEHLYQHSEEKSI